MTQRVIEMYATKLSVSMKNRSYNPIDEKNRAIDMSDNLSRIVSDLYLTTIQDQSYKRVINDNFWNENKRLSPKYTKYHINNHTFRKSPTNLENIKAKETDETFEN